MGQIVVYGAGAIGSVVGGHLFRAGCAVTLIARPAHVQAIRQGGLRLITPSGVFNLPIPAVTSPREIAFQPDDVVFLCMKGQDTEAALRDLKAIVREVPVFCFQNGVRNEEIASRYFSRVYGVMVRIGGTYLTPGEVTAHRDPPGTVIIGRYPAGRDDLADAIAAQLHAAGFRAVATPDVMPYKWGKLMGNLANAINAATDGRDPGGRIAAAVRAEARRLMQQAGLQAISLEEAQQQYPELNTPDRGSVGVESHGSTWQSLMRGEGTVETEFLNGEIVRLAQRLGSEAPLNAALQRIVEDMAAKGQKPGTYSPDQLAAAMGIH